MASTQLETYGSWAKLGTDPAVPAELQGTSAEVSAAVLAAPYKGPLCCFFTLIWFIVTTDVCFHDFYLHFSYDLTMRRLCVSERLV